MEKNYDFCWMDEGRVWRSLIFSVITFLVLFAKIIIITVV